MTRVQQTKALEERRPPPQLIQSRSRLEMTSGI